MQITECLRLTHKFEKYLDILEGKFLNSFINFRMCNNYLPVEKGRWYKQGLINRKCPLCNLNELGNEFHSRVTKGRTVHAIWTAIYVVQSSTDECKYWAIVFILVSPFPSHIRCMLCLLKTNAWLDRRLVSSQYQLSTLYMTTFIR